MRSTIRVVVLCVALSFVANSHAAAPVVIDFESLRVEDSLSHDQGFTYAEDGFTLNNLSTPHPFASFGTQSPYFAGSTALFNNTRDGVTELVRTGGGPFDLTSIDLAELNGPDTSAVAFTGELLGGGTVNEAFTLDGNGPPNGLQTFQFTGFNSVVRVVWTQVNPFHQFDNITIGRVPEPASLALLGMGAAMIGVGRRGRRG